MKMNTALLVVCLSISHGSAIADQAIQDLKHQSVPVTLSGTQPTLDQVELAIIAGCRAKGWRPVETDRNMIKASIWVREKHFAEVEIPFSRDSYSILYKASQNLDYDAKNREIHRNYNKWVVLLSRSIQEELRFY